MRRERFLWISGLAWAGCGLLLGEPSTTQQSLSDAQATAQGSDASSGQDGSQDGAPLACVFGDVVPLTELNTDGQDASPSLSDDERTIFFQRPGQDNDVFVATRTDRSSRFGNVSAVIALNAASKEETPFATRNGTSVYFVSDRVGGLGSFDIYQASRTASGPSTPVNVTVLNTARLEGSPTLPRDELTIYFHSLDTKAGLNFDLWHATRASPTATFSAPSAAAELNTSFRDLDPSISADGLTIYFASDRPGGKGALDIWTATRVTRDGTFGEPHPLAEANSPEDDLTPFLSSDGLTLYFTSDRGQSSGQWDLHYVRRPCVP